MDACFAVLGIIAHLTLSRGDSHLAVGLGIGVVDTIHAAVLLVMTVASLKAYSIIAGMDINPNPVSFLNDFLLLICIPAFFLLAGTVLTASRYYVLQEGVMKLAIGHAFVQVLSVSNNSSTLRFLL